MARVKTVLLKCDGCGNTVDAEKDGTATVNVDEKGSTHTRRLDLCPDCVAKLPEGTKRKRPEKKDEAATEATPAATPAETAKK